VSPVGDRLAEEPPPYRSGPPRRAGASGHTEIGRKGEEAAARHLQSLGYVILERRFRTRAGEIDLVARDGNTLVFVEVKARTSLACGRPAEAVDCRKRGRIARVASLYLARRGGGEAACRFDVVEVLLEPGSPPCVHLISNAFGE
jgi:putative endonuclease